MKQKTYRSSPATTSANVAKAEKAGTKAFTRKGSTESTEAQAHPTKEVIFLGSSRADLKDMPDEVKDEAGAQLLAVQFGDTPVGSKAMPRVGTGARELIIDRANSWFRVFYVATFDDAVYVLHAFQKATNETPDHDIDIGKSRFKLIKQPKVKPK